MTLVANPNGLLIASTLFALSGIAILAKAFLSTQSSAELDADRKTRQNEIHIASWVGLPMLGASAFLQGVGQFVSGPPGSGLVCLLLALALTLLMYALLEGSVADAMKQKPTETLEQAPRPLLAPPKLKAVEIHEVAAEVQDAVRHALPT